MTQVLIAEDNPVNRELLRELLEIRGYTVSEACDGQEAVRMVAEIRPDVVLLDIGMPGLDGYGVVCKIRGDPKFANLPILAITAYAMQGDREKILQSGFDGYLAKPIDAIALEQELVRLLSKPDSAAAKGGKGPPAQPERPGSLV